MRLHASTRERLSILDRFQSMAVRSLDEVRADIEAHRAKRLAAR